MQRSKHIVAIVAAFITFAPVLAQAEAVMVGEFDDWRVFTEDTPTGRVCFAASVPKSVTGTYEEGNRGSTFVTISMSAADQRNDQISIKAGYTYHSEYSVTVKFDEEDDDSKVRGRTIQLAPKGEFAWSISPADNTKMLDGMLWGLDMRVVAMSTRKNTSNDVYSLRGFTAARNSARAECGL